jgi:hypothetical protein
MTANPETRLLLCCARPDDNEALAGRVNDLVQQGIDWEMLWARSRHHRLWPLLHYRLEAICPERLPNDFRRRLRGACRKNTRRNLEMTRQLILLLEQFNDNGILAIPYKGPVLAMQVYRDLALRHVGDLDIVVHRSDVPLAQTLLLNSGYELALNGRPDTSYDWNKNYSLEFHKAETRIEIHWAFVKVRWALPLVLYHLEQRLAPVALGGRSIQTFALEDLLLLLYLHGGKHNWGRLVWVADFARVLVEAKMLDWDNVLEQANKLRVRRLLFLGMLMAHDLLAAEIPPLIWVQAQRDKTAVKVANTLQERLFEALPMYETDEQALYYFQIRERVLDKWPFIRYYFGRLRRRWSVRR